MIFVGGLVCGAALGGMFVVKSIQHAVRHPENVPGRVAARLERRLKLSEAQTEQVRAALVKRQRAMLSIRHEVQPRLEQEFTGLESDISDVLNDEQRTRVAINGGEFPIDVDAAGRCVATRDG